MLTDIRILCAGEEVLMRVRYVSPLCGLTFRWMGFVPLVGFAVCLVLCLFAWWLLLFCGGLVFVAVVFAVRSYPIHLSSHTEDVRLSSVFSETGTRPCSGDTMSLVRYVDVSLSVLDCLYPRDPPQPVGKKKIDDNRKRCRFTLGEAPDSNGKQTLVIAASSQLPRTILFDQSQPTSRHSVTGPPHSLSRPALPKFGVYFCHTKIFRNILLRDGIKPTTRTSSSSPSTIVTIALKLHATDTDDISTGVLNSRLNQRGYPFCLFINIPAAFDAGFVWTSLDNSVIGTPKVPLLPAFFHGPVDISGSTPVDYSTHPPHQVRHDLPVSPPPTDLSESRINAQADARVQQILAAPAMPPAQPPPKKQTSPRMNMWQTTTDGAP